jgi:hypothetical protein
MWKGRKRLEDLHVGAKVILNRSQINRMGGCGLGQMAEDREQWHALINSALNARVHKGWRMPCIF